MATSEELKETLEKALKGSKVIEKLEAIVRTELFKLMNNQNESLPPQMPENITINEMIREYLEFNGYKSSLDVFLAETGHQPLTRAVLKKQLKLDEEGFPDVPLIYGLVNSN